MGDPTTGEMYRPPVLERKSHVKDAIVWTADWRLKRSMHQGFPRFVPGAPIRSGILKQRDSAFLDTGEQDKVGTSFECRCWIQKRLVCHWKNPHHERPRGVYEC